MEKALSAAALAVILKMQQNELDESVIYRKIAKFAKGDANKATLNRLADEEAAHYEIWKKYTGVENDRILSNLRALYDLGSQTILRCVLIPEVNLNEAHALALAEIYQSLSHCRHIELLPYHPYGLSKSEQLGRCDVRFTQPEQKDMEAFAAILTARNIPVKLYGSML